MDRHLFDEAYLHRLAAGDAETEKHFTQYFGQLLGIKLRGRLRSHSSVEDVRQETFLRVIQSLRKGSKIHQPERFGAFVNSVCNNVLLELYRSQKRDNPLSDDQLDVASGEPGPDAGLVTEERKRHVHKVLAELPEKDREIIRLLFFEEIDKDEVCRQFMVDRNYLRVLLHRAKNRLRAGLGKAIAVGMGLFLV